MGELDVTVEGRVARVVLNRPGVLNALSPSLLTELIARCGELAHDESVQVVVIRGANGSFSAGADLPAFLSALTGSDAETIADLGRRAALAVVELPQVTLAAIDGHCIGGGVVLAGACDLRITSDRARFLVPELDAGIPLAWGGTEALVRLIGETVAADWILSCREVGPEEALRAGFVSRVVPADALRDELDALVETLARKPQRVLRVTKRQLNAVRAGTFDAREDAAALLATLRDPEALETGQQYLAKTIRKG
ncbi:MAG: enoyl-CoA hydratase/isomerase family protein [Polyangiales bacterium]